ncbi:MAG: methylenetetrahydrofolate reductase [NAD(P)H] [Planctomycetota bacterium]|nr:MAG: methylenetetrahydrofolate reductase [NAD(P)H] [Planctomycetota bacterium]
MKIRDVYGRGRPVFSFEFFPPKTDKGEANLMATCADLQDAVQPDFVSVTYGAGGSTRDRTHAIVSRVQKELRITAMAHQTCIASTRDEVRRSVESLEASGIENILALRGDPPEEDAGFEPPAGGFAHATDLIEYLRESHDLSIGGAFYPEGHPESSSAEDDLHWTKRKLAAGADFLISQIFFDNRYYFDFVDRAAAAGIDTPLVPGIMPITNVAQIQRFTKMCGATIPPELDARLRRHADDPAAVMATGVEHAITQCRELLERGAPGLHFYTLNKSHATRTILAAIRR